MFQLLKFSKEVEIELKQSVIQGRETSPGKYGMHLRFTCKFFLK